MYISLKNGLGSDIYNSVDQYIIVYTQEACEDPFLSSFFVFMSCHDDLSTKKVMSVSQSFSDKVVRELKLLSCIVFIFG